MTNKQKYDAIVMNAILNYTDDYTKEDYEKSANYTYSKHITMKQFKEYVQDVINGGVSSFKFDW